MPKHKASHHKKSSMPLDEHDGKHAAHKEKMGHESKKSHHKKSARGK